MELDPHSSGSPLEGSGHRRLLVLRGTADQTLARARNRLAGFTPARVLWIGAWPGQPDAQAPGYAIVEPRRVSSLLGRSYDALVLDGHGGVDAELLGQAHGFVRGGGAFVLRLDAREVAPAEAFVERLVAESFAPAEVGRRWPARVELALARAQPWIWTGKGALEAPDPELGPPAQALSEQRALVERLVERWGGERPSFTALLADRGRGKSSALGLALAQLARAARGAEPRALVSAGSAAALAELERFAGDATPPFVPFDELARGQLADAEPPELILVDEAAQLPAASLRRLVEHFPRAHFVFATTTHGYEGTGRGFALRFLTWLEAWLGARGLELAHERLERPIRWAPGDPLERFVFDTLLLDAEPAALGEGAAPAPDELEAVELEREQLASDEPRLRELFGLLVQAHYRTTPGDLHRLLDAPNLRVHALLLRGRVVAATLVALEGGLAPEVCADMIRGRRRVRAQALADSLVTHLGEEQAGRLKMIRSVRIATHPGLRRRGLASRLVEHVHRSYAPDLFGTLFGATPELLHFRRGLGYARVRTSASRGARSGEPSVVMLRPCSAPARELLARLRARLAWELELQLDLLGREAPLRAGLLEQLRWGLPEAEPLDEASCRAQVWGYAHGPRTYASVARPLQRLVEVNAARLDELAQADRALIRARVLEELSWEQLRARGGFETVPALMRALRRAVRELLARMPETAG